MMIHSRWFGLTQPQDAIVGKKGIATIVNHLQLYAKSKELTITVEDENKQPCAGVAVCYEVLNYSEFGNIATTITDQLGQTRIVTGLGSIHISVQAGDLYADYLLNTQKEEQCTLLLRPIKTKLDGWKELESIAPIDCVLAPVVLTKEEKLRNEQKLNEATKKRLYKISQFYKTEEADEIALYYNEDKEAVLTILKKASGNFAEIIDFLQRIKDQELDRKLAVRLLRSLSDKDYLDIKASMLINHLKAIAGYKDLYPEDVFNSYLLCPRVQFERITDEVEFLCNYLQDKKAISATDPKSIWNYINDHIVSIPEKEYGQIITSAKGCLLSGVGSRLSKEILCIRSLRLLGIPARMNPIDGMMEYYEKGEFVPVEKKQVYAKACVFFEGDGNVQWKYSQNWSIGKWSENGFQTLQLYGQITTEKLGVLELEDGIYRVITCNRLPNGNILAKEYCFEVKDGQDTWLVLSMKQAELSQMLEEIELPEVEVQWRKCEVSVKELVGPSKALFLWLEVNREPTEHILNELYESSDQMNRLGTKIYFVLKSEDDLKDTSFCRTNKVLENVEILYDTSETNTQVLARRMYVDPDKLPLIIVAKKGFIGTYATSGYNVGTADMLIRILSAD
jgi:hypothetical protein